MQHVLLWPLVCSSPCGPAEMEKFGSWPELPPEKPVLGWASMDPSPDPTPFPLGSGELMNPIVRGAETVTLAHQRPVNRLVRVGTANPVVNGVGTANRVVNGAGTATSSPKRPAKII